MRRSPESRSLLLSALLATAQLVSGCAVSQHTSIRSSALEYLYPKGAEACPPADVTLKLPVRVGLAFAPTASTWTEPFTEDQKQRLLAWIAEGFKSQEYVKLIETIPTHYLNAGGGFENLDRLASAFGLDLMVLVSYDQRQFSETTRLSWTYLTVVGAFFVQGEKNETRTFMDAVVYDISSRALLFRAFGESSLKDESTPVDVDRVLRKVGDQGFEKATDGLIANLRTALAAFEDQAKSGTVRGAGTPAITLTDASGAAGGGGEAGGIAFGWPELAAAGVIGALTFWRRRRATGA